MKAYMKTYIASVPSDIRGYDVFRQVKVISQAFEYTILVRNSTYRNRSNEKNEMGKDSKRILIRSILICFNVSSACSFSSAVKTLPVQI